VASLQLIPINTHVYDIIIIVSIVVCGFKILQFAKFHENWYPQMLVQFCSVHYDLITEETLHLQYTGGFHTGPGPH